MEDIQNRMISRDDFDKVISGFNIKLTKLEKDVSSMNEELAATKIERDALKSTLLSFEDRLKTMEDHKKNNANTPANNSTLNARIETLENKGRECNLAIFGIKKNNLEPTDYVNTTKKILKDHLAISPTILNAYGLGKSTGAPVIVKLKNTTDRDIVLKNSRKLKGTGIAITRDYCPGTLKKRKILNIRRLEALRDGKKATLRDDVLIINSESFIVDNNNCIVPLHPSRTFSELQRD